MAQAAEAVIFPRGAVADSHQEDDPPKDCTQGGKKKRGKKGGKTRRQIEEEERGPRPTQNTATLEQEIEEEKKNKNKFVIKPRYGTSHITGTRKKSRRTSSKAILAAMDRKRKLEEQLVTDHAKRSCLEGMVLKNVFLTPGVTSDRCSLVHCRRGMTTEIIGVPQFSRLVSYPISLDGKPALPTCPNDDECRGANLFPGVKDPLVCGYSESQFLEYERTGAVPTTRPLCILCQLYTINCEVDMARSENLPNRTMTFYMAINVIDGFKGEWCKLVNGVPILGWNPEDYTLSQVVHDGQVIKRISFDRICVKSTREIQKAYVPKSRYQKSLFWQRAATFNNPGPSSTVSEVAALLQHAILDPEAEDLFEPFVFSVKSYKGGFTEEDINAYLLYWKPGYPTPVEMALAERIKRIVTLILKFTRQLSSGSEVAKDPAYYLTIYLDAHLRLVGFLNDMPVEERKEMDVFHLERKKLSPDLYKLSQLSPSESTLPDLQPVASKMWIVQKSPQSSGKKGVSLSDILYHLSRMLPANNGTKQSVSTLITLIEKSEEFYNMVVDAYRAILLGNIKTKHGLYPRIEATPGQRMWICRKTRTELYEKLKTPTILLTVMSWIAFSAQTRGLWDIHSNFFDYVAYIGNLNNRIVDTAMGKVPGKILNCPYMVDSQKKTGLDTVEIAKYILHILGNKTAGKNTSSIINKTPRFSAIRVDQLPKADNKRSKKKFERAFPYPYSLRGPTTDMDRLLELGFSQEEATAISGIFSEGSQDTAMAVVKTLETPAAAALFRLCEAIVAFSWKEIDLPKDFLAERPRYVQLCPYCGTCGAWPTGLAFLGMKIRSPPSIRVRLLMQFDGKRLDTPHEWEERKATGCRRPIPVCVLCDKKECIWIDTQKHGALVCNISSTLRTKITLVSCTTCAHTMIAIPQIWSGVAPKCYVCSKREVRYSQMSDYCYAGHEFSSSMPYRYTFSAYSPDDKCVREYKTCKWHYFEQMKSSRLYDITQIPLLFDFSMLAMIWWELRR